jgi:two-component system cell cycle sensor histidine kinase/response regulator CckA
VISQTHDDLIHLVVSDVVMPKMSGPDMVVLLKQMRVHLKVLHMCGYPDETSSQHSVADMAMLDKPFSASELPGPVRDVLTEQRPFS